MRWIAMTGAGQTLLLSSSALFSIVNPIGSAVIFSQITAGCTNRERHALARRVAVCAALLLLAALWGGTSLLSLFGIGLPALRLAGGLVMAASAWRLLDEAQLPVPEHGTGGAFYPLTMPLTVGPGTIAVAIAIGSNPPAGEPGRVLPHLAASLAALGVAAAIWGAFSCAGALAAWLGPGGARTVTRLSAFLLLCIGIETGLHGVASFVRAEFGIA
jgi:multiple antibiotic resistance protein